MTKYRFKLPGLSLEYTSQMIEIDPNQTIRDIKKTVQREYKLNPILAIQFIFKGKVLPDHLKLASSGIQPERDVITVMATQAGPSKSPSEIYNDNFLENKKEINSLIKLLKSSTEPREQILNKLQKIQMKLEMQLYQLIKNNDEDVQEIIKNYEHLSMKIMRNLENYKDNYNSLEDQDQSQKNKNIIAKQLKRKRVTSFIIFLFSFSFFLTVLIIALRVIF